MITELYCFYQKEAERFRDSLFTLFAMNYLHNYYSLGIPALARNHSNVCEFGRSKGKP